MDKVIVKDERNLATNASPASRFPDIHLSRTKLVQAPHKSMYEKIGKRGLQHITDRHYKELAKYARDNFHHFNRHGIHLFRVEYKKLRAFLRMLSESGRRANSISVSKGLRQAYRKTGAIRDLQLQLADGRNKLNDRASMPTSYFTLLKRKIHKQQVKLKDILSSKPIEKSKERTDSHIPRIFTIHDFIGYIENKQVNLDSICSAGKFRNDDLHALRKILKDLFYNSHTWSAAMNERPQSHDPDTLKVNPIVESLLEDLGVFQDQCSAIALLEKRSLHTLDKKDKKLLVEEKHMLTQKNKSFKRTIIKKLQGLTAPISVRSQAVS